jgi:hypothetical protein
MLLDKTHRGRVAPTQGLVKVRGVAVLPFSPSTRTKKWINSDPAQPSYQQLLQLSSFASGSSHPFVFEERGGAEMGGLGSNVDVGRALMRLNYTIIDGT